jgi:hypothetical protein
VRLAQLFHLRMLHEKLEAPVQYHLHIVIKNFGVIPALVPVEVRVELVHGEILQLLKVDKDAGGLPGRSSRVPYLSSLLPLFGQSP